jgi:hypothetical protein
MAIPNGAAWPPPKSDVPGQRFCVIDRVIERFIERFIGRHKGNGDRPRFGGR